MHTFKKKTASEKPCAFKSRHWNPSTSVLNTAKQEKAEWTSQRLAPPPSRQSLQRLCVSGSQGRQSRTGWTDGATERRMNHVVIPLARAPDKPWRSGWQVCASVCHRKLWLPPFKKKKTKKSWKKKCDAVLREDMYVTRARRPRRTPLLPWSGTPAGWRRRGSERTRLRPPGCGRAGGSGTGGETERGGVREQTSGA